MRPPASPYRLLITLALLLPLAGCGDKLSGFEAGFSSNTVSAHAGPPAGNKLRFRMGKQATDAARARLYLLPHRGVLHVSGYLPVTPDAVEDAGAELEVSFTLPEDLIAAAAASPLNNQPVRGVFYVPYERGLVSFTGTEMREPAGTQVLGVSLRPVHAGPMTSFAEGIGSFLRSLYAAR